MWVMYINISMSRKTGQEKERIFPPRGEVWGAWDVRMGALASVQAPLPLHPSSVEVRSQIHKDAGHHGPLVNFRSCVPFCTSPRTSNGLPSNYISTEMYNAIKPFIYLFFHFASALSDDCSGPSIRSEG